MYLKSISTTTLFSVFTASYQIEILLQEEHLCNVTFVTLLQTQSLWPMFKNHLHSNMIFSAWKSRFGKHFEYIWICTFNDLFISNCFLKCKKMYWVLFSESKANKQTTPILTTVLRHPNKTATNSTITLNRTC